MDWNGLFWAEKHCEKPPESEVYRFIGLLEERFASGPLRIWDLGCGAGRHAVAIAKTGHHAYASDNAPKGLERTRQYLDICGVSATLALADMTECPWGDVSFHGVIAWNVLHHNTLANTGRAVDVVHRSLVSGGLLLATLKSDKADWCGQGEEIEPGTFVLNKGPEAGVPHHYFNEKGIRQLFCSGQWRLLILAEQVITNYEHPDRFWEFTPFPWTTWGVLAEKRG